MAKVQAPVASRAILGPTICLTAHHTTFQADPMCPFPDTTRSVIPTLSRELKIAGNQGTPGILEPRVVTFVNPVNPGMPVRAVTQESIATPERAGLQTQNGMKEAANMPIAERWIAHAMRIALSYCHATAPPKGIGPIGTRVAVGLLSHPTNTQLPQRSNLHQLTRNHP